MQLIQAGRDLDLGEDKACRMFDAAGSARMAACEALAEVYEFRPAKKTNIKPVSNYTGKQKGADMAERDVISKLILSGDSTGVVSAIEKAKASAKGLNSDFDLLGRFATGLGPLMGGIGLVAITQQLHEAGMASERLRNSFEAATGSVSKGAAEYGFARSEANRLGLDLQSTADAYLKLTASAKGTALEGEKTRQIFSSVAGASRALGLSAEQQNGALLAISQMMSKGTVQSEELRGQLGERLPGAFNIAARAMGVTTMELGKMLEAGKVIAADFLPPFAAELEKTFPAGKKAMSGLTAETERLKTAWSELKMTVMERGMSDIMAGTARGTADVVSSFTNVIDVMIEESKFKIEKFKLWSKSGISREEFAGFQSTMLGGGPLPVSPARRQSELRQAALTGLVAEGTRFGSEDNLVNLARMTPQESSAGPAKAKEQTKAEIKAAEARKAAAAQLSADLYQITARDMQHAVDLKNEESSQIYQIIARDMQRAVDLKNEESSQIYQITARDMEWEQQRQIDNASSLSYWAAQKRLNYADALTMESEFNAMQEEMRGSATAAELLRIDQQQAYLEQSWAMNTDSYATYEARMTQITAAAEQQRTAVKRREAQGQLWWVEATFKNMATIADGFYQLSGKKSKEAFLAYQVSKSGETIISTGSAAMKSYDAMCNIPYVGPVLGAIAAAAAIATGAVQLQSIWSTSPEGGGSLGAVSGGGVSASSGSMVTQPVAQPVQAAPQYTIILNGAIGERRWFEDNLPEIMRDMNSRNVNLGVAYT